MKRLLNFKGSIFERYHLANNQEISLLELSEIIEIASNKKLSRNFKDKRNGEVNRNSSEFILAKKILNFQPKKNFYEEIPLLYDWIKKNEF